ncbi:hypothetical protein JCM10213_003248 [Rhodosporidiobolus nylandii]
MLEIEKDGKAVEEQKESSAFHRFRRCLQASSSVLNRHLHHICTALKLATASSRLGVRTPTPPSASFPSPAEIREHGKLVQSSPTEDRQIWSIEWQGVNMYVKEGRDVHAGEAHLTELARKKTGLPIPKVYRVEQHGDSTFIYLEALPGEDAAIGFLSLTSLPLQQQRLQSELERALQRLHRVKAPAGARVGAPTSRPLSALFAERKVAPSLRSAAELHSYLRQLYLSHNPDRAEEYDREISPHLDDNARLVLVHGDLHEDNILVQDGRLSGIIDFGRAGWYPEWVEQWTPGLQMRSLQVVPRRLMQAMGEATVEGQKWKWMYKAEQGWRGKIED